MFPFFNLDRCYALNFPESEQFLSFPRFSNGDHSDLMQSNTLNVLFLIDELAAFEAAESYPLEKSARPRRLNESTVSSKSASALIFVAFLFARSRFNEVRTCENPKLKLVMANSPNSRIAITHIFIELIDGSADCALWHTSTAHIEERVFGDGTFSTTSGCFNWFIVKRIGTEKCWPSW